MYITMLYQVALIVLASAGIGFVVRQLLHKFRNPDVLTLLSGFAVTLLFCYLTKTIFGIEFYGVALAVLGFLFYVLFIGLWNDRKGSLTKRAGMIVSVLFIASVLYLSAIDSEPGVNETFLLPMGFEGCVLINYEVEGAPPLRIEGNEIVYRVPDDGIIDTSSPIDFGWVSKENSGSYRLRAFYVDQAGNKVQELSQEKIRFGANGSVKEEGKPERTHYYQLFGDEEVEAEGCPAVLSS
ncbi:DUF6843 domain-containing protein [Bhargavaea massiliensis]|uniref:DUF6843 domain-containing protein n=1 Tax=Bhargavaea massiliensis TaxID=2697500 RepID=UPI001BCF8B9B|nr:hypothetical protein [Bhargavaea massiliensis]